MQKLADDIPVDIVHVTKAKRDIIQEFVAESERKHKDEHFFVCDIGDIIEKYQQWMRLLPRVKLFYAVKCSSDKGLLQILSDLGASFDCASKMEIEKVLDLGISPDRVIYTQTYKPISTVIYAERQKVSLLAFDSESELRKIKSHHPTARLLLRILLIQQYEATDTSGNKIGCPSVQVRDLLRLAKELDLAVVGVSFHVGTGIKDPEAYKSALKESKNVFEIGREMGFNMNVLDIGGGFPGEQTPSTFFREITYSLNETLDNLFPPDEGVNIVAEPGRYVVASAYSVVVNVIGKRWFPEKLRNRENGNSPDKSSCEADSNTLMYYVNDSAFGSFLVGRLYDPGTVTYIPNLIKRVGGVPHKSIIWGFTCPGRDCIIPSMQLPELDIGDWLYFEDMGAYTTSVSSNFNGLETPEIVYYCSEKLWNQVYP